MVAAIVEGEIGLFDYLTGKSGKQLSPKPRTGPPLPAGSADVLGVLAGVVRKA